MIIFCSILLNKKMDHPGRDSENISDSDLEEEAQGCIWQPIGPELNTGSTQPYMQEETLISHQ